VVAAVGTAVDTAAAGTAAVGTAAVGGQVLAAVTAAEVAGNTPSHCCLHPTVDGRTLRSTSTFGMGLGCGGVKEACRYYRLPGGAEQCLVEEKRGERMVDQVG
jgi:hypothetical protein